MYGVSCSHHGKNLPCSCACVTKVSKVEEIEGIDRVLLVFLKLSAYWCWLRIFLTINPISPKESGLPEKYIVCVVRSDLSHLVTRFDILLVAICAGFIAFPLLTISEVLMHLIVCQHPQHPMDGTVHTIPYCTRRPDRGSQYRTFVLLSQARILLKI